MCGIAGVVRFDGRVVSEDLIRSMTALLTHRGPDDNGVWMGPSVGLGYTRLSIIDLANSRQPMSTPEGTSVIVFNGEIFNYRRLREEFDYPFSTSGDTEVVLAAVSRLGTAGIQRLKGQFAFGVFEQSSRALTLCRDRLGVLPLYYASTDSFVAFASEVKALAPALAAGFVVDEASLESYLAHRSVPAPYTMFRGVSKLLPGHVLRFDSQGRSTLEQYWSLPPVRDQLRIGRADGVDRVDHAVRRAVMDAMVADVPVGAYLSGGVDSSLITAIASEFTSGAPLATFSAGFADSPHDELPYARQVASHFGTDHHEVVLGSDDFVADWRRLSWHRDAPLSEPADVAVYRLAKIARESVKVVLSGEGSDEIFAGYPKYRLARIAALLGHAPGLLRHAAASLGDRLLPGGAVRPRIMLRALANDSEQERFSGWFAPFSHAERHALLQHCTGHQEARIPVEGDAVRRLLMVDLAVWLPDNLLERGDRMSMAASLELRPPFLDHELVELAFRLPSSLKVRHGQTKWVLKEVARRYLPPNIVERTKVGFRVPLDRWFRGSFGDFATETLLAPDSFVSSVFDRSRVRDLLDRHQKQHAQEEIRLWTLLSLEIWHQQLRTSEMTAVRPSPQARQST